MTSPFSFQIKEKRYWLCRLGAIMVATSGYSQSPPPKKKLRCLQDHRHSIQDHWMDIYIIGTCFCVEVYPNSKMITLWVGWGVNFIAETSASDIIQAVSTFASFIFIMNI